MLKSGGWDLKKRRSEMEDTTLREWYDVAVSWCHDEEKFRETETISFFDNLEDAIEFMNDDKQIESELYKNWQNDVENLFIDRWLDDSIQTTYKDREFNPIIRTIKKGE